MNLVELTIQRPDDAATTRAQQALDRAQSLTIVNDVGYASAADELKAIKGKMRELDDARKDLKRPIDEAAARIQAFFKGPLDFLAKAETIVKRKLVDYQDEQERQRIEAQRKAEEAARRERERLEAAQREVERKAREKAAAERKAAEEAAAAGRAAEAAKLAERAAATEAKAAEKAEQLQTQAAAVVAPVVQREAPKVGGIATREAWKFEVTDKSLVPDEFYVIDEKRIADRVKSLKGDTNIPGVRVWPVNVIAAGAR